MNTNDEKIINAWHQLQDLESCERFMNIEKYLSFGISDLIFKSEKEKCEYYEWLERKEQAKQELENIFFKAVSRKRSKNGI